MVLSAVVGDAFGVNEWLMGSLAGAGFAIAAERLQRWRLERARDILIDELRRGERTLSAPEADEIVAVLLRYGRAAQEGAARLNLRLMAKASPDRFISRFSTLTSFSDTPTSSLACDERR